MTRSAQIIFTVALVALVQIGCSNSPGPGPGIPQNEGSVASPISLTAESLRVCKVGKLSDGATESYYSYTGVAAGTYYIKASGFSPSSVTGFTPSVYSSSNYTGQPSFTSPYTTSLQCSSISMAPTYYLKLTNLYDSNDNVTFSLVVTTTP